jgi:peptidoglycan/LPS O-acetylase OafA/YrhL
VEFFRSTESRISTTAQGTSYLPGIDGLRAIAVLAVLLFHGGVSTLSGGFLGVEVFFVISGYLITLLLLRERESTGRNDLRAFWLRRARRLLPALAAVVVLTLSYALLFMPAEVAGLRSDALSAGGYFTNWWLIFGDQPYFETMGRPSLLQHLWSLAVEEQFYLLWPVVFAVLMRFGGRRGAFIAIMLGAVASYWLMGALHSPEAEPSRVYYGTDTRAGGLLLGAALALLWDPRRFVRTFSWRARLAANGALVAALAVLAWAFVAVDSGAGWLYPWGFVLVSGATLVALAAATNSATTGSVRFLGSKPMRWAGTRSYGLYLWHWPIFMVTRPGLDVPFDGVDLLVGRLVLAAVAAELSYRLIEQPFRRCGFRRTVRASIGRTPVPARVVSFGGGFAALALVVTTMQAHPATTPSYLADGDFQGVVGGPSATPTATATPRSTATPIPSASPTPSAEPSSEPTATPTISPTEAVPTATPTSEPPPTPPPPPPPTQPAPTQPPPVVPPPSGAGIYAIGDSVLIGAAPYLGIAGPVEVDAQIGRQVGDTISRLRAMREAGRLPEVIVVHTGNNGPLTAGQVDQIMAIAGEAKVVFVTVRVGRSWEDTTNSSIHGAASRYGNIRVADWYSATEGRPELFYSDGIHVRGEGGQLFAALVAAAIAS